jgi:hypothetical protein
MMSIKEYQITMNVIKKKKMKKLLLVLLALPFIGFGQGQCISGDCVNGYGVFTSAEGTYEGNWKNRKVHGTGVFKGSYYTYEGEHVNGKKHGPGKKTFANGTIQKGQWKNNVYQTSANTTTKPKTSVAVCNRKSKIEIATD